jgi:hypothetical protein
MARKSLKTLESIKTHSQAVAPPAQERRQQAAGTLTKKSQLIGLLRQKDGATLAAISSGLGWLLHTTRAAITGLRKGGLRIETSTSDEGTRYRLVPQPPALSPFAGTADGV